MSKSHSVRKKEKEEVFERTVKHILEIGKVVKVNDLYDEFHGDAFTNVPYFVRSFIILAENEPRIHIKSAQRAGTWAAPVDIEFPESTNKVTKKPKKKLTNTDHIKPQISDNINDHQVNEAEVKESVPEKDIQSVDMSTDHEKLVQKPSSSELFGDDEPDYSDEPEEDRFFTSDGREFEGKMTTIKPDDNWYSINKRLLTKVGYTDVIELYAYDDDQTHEYLAVTSEGKTFHFIEVD